MEIEYTSHFKRAYQGLDRLVQKRAEEKELIFRKNPFHSKLKSHKLKGELREFYSFSIDRKNRVVFKFMGHQRVVFLDVGDHDVYR